MNSNCMYYINVRSLATIILLWPPKHLDLFLNCRLSCTFRKLPFWYTVNATLKNIMTFCYVYGAPCIWGECPNAAYCVAGDFRMVETFVYFVL